MLGFFLVSNIALGASARTTTTTYQIAFDKHNKAQVTVYEKTAGGGKKAVVKKIDSYKADSTEELVILSELAEEYDLALGDVIRNAQFSYARVSSKALDSRRDDWSVSYRYKYNKTVMTMTINGTKYDYWMNTRNLTSASEELGRIYSLSSNKIMKSLRANR